MERDMHAKAIRKSKTEQLANKQKQTLVHATAIKKADKQIKQRRTKKDKQTNRLQCQTQKPTSLDTEDGQLAVWLWAV